MSKKKRSREELLRSQGYDTRGWLFGFIPCYVSQAKPELPIEAQSWVPEWFITAAMSVYGFFTNGGDFYVRLGRKL